MHNKQFNAKNLATENNSFKIELPPLNDIKIIDALVGINISNVSASENSFTVNFSALKNSTVLCEWSNVDTFKNISIGQLLKINISDELQTAILKGATHILLSFQGEKSITFANNYESDFLNIDYISLSEYQANGSSHQIDLGTIGSSSIDLATGKLLTTIPIVSTNNKPLPLSISAIYNSTINKNLPQIGMPQNWNLNCNQFIIEEKDKDSSLKLTYIDENGKSQLLEEKYYYLDNGEKKFVPRSEIYVDLKGELKYKLQDGNIKDIKTLSITPSGLKLATSYKEINGSNLIETEPEKLSNERINLKNLKSNKKSLQHNIKICKEQLVLYALSRNAAEKQIQMQQKNISSTDEEYIYANKIKSFKNELNQATTEEPTKKLSLADYAFTYGGKVDETDFYGSNNYRGDLLTFTKYLYTDINKSDFINLVSNNMPAEFYENVLHNDINACWKDFSKSLPSGQTLSEDEQNRLTNFAYKDLYNIDTQIETLVEQYKDYKNSLEELENSITISEHNIKTLEQQVPVYYLYNDSNIIYGFGKTYDESGEETNVYRLILIADSYENTIFFSYESITSNKITSIIDSSEKNITLNYSKETGLLQEIIDLQDNTTKFEYNEKNELISIKNSSNNIEFQYSDALGNNDNNQYITHILSNSCFGTKFTYQDNQIASVEKITRLKEISHNNPQFETNWEVVGKDKVTFSYDNFKSTTLTNESNKKVTYLFDKNGKVRTVYENGFSTTKCDSNSITCSNVTDFNYQDNKISLKTSILPYSKNYLENSSFNESDVQPACETISASNLYLGNLVCGDDSIPYSYNVYHNHYKFKDSVKACITLEKTTTNNPFQDFFSDNCHKLFILSCWAKADSAFIITDEDKDTEYYNINRKFELQAVIHYEDEENARTPIVKSFDWRNTNWQYCSLPIEFEKTNIKSIKFYFDYSDNTNSQNVEFTKLELKLGDFERINYNSDNLPILIETGHSEWIKKYNYNNNNQVVSELIERKISKENEINNFETIYEYNKNGNLIKTTDFNGIVKETIYNDKGYAIKTLTYHKEEPANMLVEESALNDKGETTSELNELGEKVVDYEYLEGTNTITSQTSVNGHKTSYGYNNSNTLIEQTSTIDGETNSNIFGYTLDFLTSLKHNDFEINYNYDSQGRTNKISIDGVTYLTKEYNDNEEIVNLGTNEKYKYTLNNDGKATQIFYKPKNSADTQNFSSSELIVENIYDIYGNLVSSNDKVSNNLHTYSIDKFGNTTKEENTQHSVPVIIVNNYDSNHSQVQNASIQINDEKLKYDYDISNDPNNTLKNIHLSKNNLNVMQQSLEYDRLNRIHNLKNEFSNGNNINKEFVYLQNGNRTSNLISKVNFSNNSLILERLSYKYDSLGNITEIRENNQLQARYKYDELSRIIREDNNVKKKTFTFFYDAGGNITQKIEYNFTLVDNLDNESPLNTSNYAYPSSGWRDKLMLFNGEEFKYDELGNPKIYRNKTLEWSHGRRLDAFDVTETNGQKNSLVTYQYNASGIRISKKINTSKLNKSNNCSCNQNDETCNCPTTFTTEYFLNGNKIIKQKDCCNTLTFYYGADGVTGFHLENSVIDEDYFYKKNAQNDIIGIYNSNGTLICKYNYDAWGNEFCQYLSKNGTYVPIEENYEYNNIENYNRFVAFKNPFRYRSYYYDFETGLYYLNSRYYDPTLGRYINADDINNVSPNELNGLNLFAYCVNNPVNLSDSCGHAWWHWLIAALVVVIAAVAVVVTAGGVVAGMTAVVAVASGCSAGTLGATIAAGVFIGAATTFAAFSVIAGIDAIGTLANGGSFGNAVNTFSNYGETTMWSTLTSGVLGGFMGYIQYKSFNSFSGTHTPGKSKSFSTYIENGSYKKVTHYNRNGDMSWSKHFTTHNLPGHSNPHWHLEDSINHKHSQPINSLFEFICEFIKRLRK